MGISGTMILFSFLFKMLIPLTIIGVIIFLIVADSNKKYSGTNGQPLRFDANGNPIGGQPARQSRMNTSSVLLIIGSSFIILSAIAFVAANWVKLSNEGRVFILVGASILSFAISVVLKAIAKLDLTSAAFYIMGTTLSVVSLITAGDYKLFGSWFSISGEGMGLLFALASMIISVAAFSAYPLYKKQFFNYIGLSFVSTGIVFLGVQITDNFEQFAPVIIMAQLIITAAVHLLKPQKGTFLELPVRIIGDITAVVYACIAMSYVFSTTFDATPYTFFVLGVLMLQFFIYGIFKKKPWMFILLNITAIYTALVGVFGLNAKYGTSFVMLFFAFITLIIFAVNLFAPKNSTVSKAITFSFAVLGAILSLCANNERFFGMNLVVPLAVSAFILWYSLSKEMSLQVVAGLASPVMPFFTALYLNNRLFELNGKEQYAEISTISFSGLAIFYMAVTVLMLYMPKLSFWVHAHYPMKSQTVLYANMIAAAAVLLNCTRYSALFMIPVGVCIFHFLISNLMSSNITAAGSVIGVILVTYRVLQHFFGADSEAAMYSMFGLFIVLLVVSRIMFSDSFIIKKENKTLADVILLSSWMCVIAYPTFDRLSIFLRLMAVAVFLAALIKKNTDKESAAILLSFSSFIAAFACITRPFLTPDSSVINSKITLAIIAFLGFAYRIIWKQHKTASKVTSTILFVISFIGLIVDAMVFHNAPNTIFVMAVTAGILLLSFYTKNMTWFTVSSIALVVITVYSTRKYFTTMGWWIYLFIVGVVLIVVAAVNEYCKKKGETMKSAATKTFSEWKW